MHWSTSTSCYPSHFASSVAKSSSSAKGKQVKTAIAATSKWHYSDMMESQGKCWLFEKKHRFVPPSNDIVDNASLDSISSCDSEQLCFDIPGALQDDEHCLPFDLWDSQPSSEDGESLSTCAESPSMPESNTVESDETLLKEHQSYMSSNEHFRTKADFAQIELLQLCEDIHAPLYAYDAIMKWACKHFSSGDMCRQLGSNPPLRQTVLSRLSTEFGFQAVQPSVEKVFLPSSQQKVDVVYFQFQQMLRSLLTSSIMQDDNLVINESNPTELPTPSGSVGEILSGHWARRTHAKLCNGKDDMLVPLILYIDKTHTEEKGVNNVEPVCFTLGIFKKSV